MNPEPPDCVIVLMARGAGVFTGLTDRWSIEPGGKKRKSHVR